MADHMADVAQSNARETYPLRAAAGTSVRETSTDWLRLTDELNNTLAMLSRLIQRATREEDDYDVLTDEIITRVLHGVLQASEIIALMNAASTSNPVALLEHPTVQLARAYVGAFKAIGSGALLIGDFPSDRLLAGATAFVQLAQRAAGVVREAVSLLAGERQLGSVANACKVIGGLEDQADTLFRSQIALVFGRDGSDVTEVAESRWTEQSACMVRMFTALESLTDRCEDIADALLLVERVR